MCSGGNKTPPPVEKVEPAAAPPTRVSQEVRQARDDKRRDAQRAAGVGGTNKTGPSVNNSNATTSAAGTLLGSGPR